MLAQEGCVGHLLQTCRGWGLKKRAPGATGAPVHRPDREFGAAVGAAAGSPGCNVGIMPSSAAPRCSLGNRRISNFPGTLAGYRPAVGYYATEAEAVAAVLNCPPRGEPYTTLP